MNSVQRLFTRKLVIKLLGQTFEPATRDASGSLILKKSRFVLGCLLLFLFIMACGIPAIFLETSVMEVKEFINELIWLVYLGVIATLYTIYQTLSHLVFRTVADEHSIKVRSLSGSRTIHYDQLSSVGYTRFNNGRILLKSAAGTIRIPIGVSGAAELVELISGKIGEEACADAIKELDVRRKEMKKWGREV